MIQVLALYPRIEGKKFNYEYYKSHHVQLIKDVLIPSTVEINITEIDQENTSRYFAITKMNFESWEHFVNSYRKHAKELEKNRLQFTDTNIIIQTSEINS